MQRNAEKGTEILYRTKYLMGIIRNGNPANKADYFAMRPKLYKEEKTSQNYISREWDNKGFEDLLKMWEDEDLN